MAAVIAVTLAAAAPAKEVVPVPIDGTLWNAKGRLKLSISQFASGLFRSSGTISVPDGGSLSVTAQVKRSFTGTLAFTADYVRDAGNANKLIVTLDTAGLEALRSYVERDLEAYLNSIGEPQDMTVTLGSGVASGSIKRGGRKLTTKTSFPLVVRDQANTPFPGSLSFKFGGTPAVQ